MCHYTSNLGQGPVTTQFCSYYTHLLEWPPNIPFPRLLLCYETVTQVSLLPHYTNLSIQGHPLETSTFFLFQLFTNATEHLPFPVLRCSPSNLNHASMSGHIELFRDCDGQG